MILSFDTSFFLSLPLFLLAAKSPMQPIPATPPSNPKKSKNSFFPTTKCLRPDFSCRFPCNGQNTLSVISLPNLVSIFPDSATRVAPDAPRAPWSKRQVAGVSGIRNPKI